MRAIENEIGEPIDPSGIRVAYGPPSSAITLEALAKAEAVELSQLQQRFAGFCSARAYIMTALLFPALRQTFADLARDEGIRQVVLDDQALYDFALSAMNEVSWKEGLAALKARSTSKSTN